MKQEDRESLLGDYGVRKYDADIGRFLSVDKLFQQQPGYSPYHYSANDPVNGSDGSDLFTETEMSQSSITDDDQLPDQISSGSWLTWGGSGAKGMYFAKGKAIGSLPAPGSGMPWDEYPFASTLEGRVGATITKVSLQEQRIQGGTLSAFYKKYNMTAGYSFKAVFIE